MNLTVPRASILFHLLPGLLFLFSLNAGAQNINFGKSYINVTKGLNGGTVETGDTLEIRSSIVVRAGTYDSCRYQDAIPAGTVYIPGTIRVLTNEGKIYKQFTDAANDDPGWITGAAITINMGFNPAAAPATASRRGRIANTHKPSFFGSTCIMVASFRIRVTTALGTNISTGGGNMTYKSGLLAVQTFTFPSNIVRVYTNYGICANTVGVNALGTESNGTFGFGKPRNRGASANVPPGYTYSSFTTNMPNDYYYGVANNTSTQTNYTTLNTWAKPDNSVPTHRVFNLWDIIGDHTGAASPTLGNPAADTINNNNGGYMLIINAAYRIDSAFQQTISGLCPNTYYEISCWMRNICSKCGCDSNGVGATGGAYIPTAPGDSSGVAPNLTFDIDGVDYYTTGNLRYNGLWTKRGFTYLTGPTQSSFTMKFFNNAPGGGGNDWALDDISVSTCSPNMKYSPSLNPIVCDSNSITIYDTVRSFFNNYTYYKWQRSTDGGATWTDITAPAGPATPVWNGTAWQYVVSYTVPPAFTYTAGANDMYRLVVATTAANLSDANCNFTDPVNIIKLTVIECGIPLNSSLIAFSGKNSNDHAALQWTTTKEEENYLFDVEKSTDGVHFFRIASVNSYNNSTAENNTYTFTDPALLNGNSYYRINMKNNAGHSVYSRTIRMSADPVTLAFESVINPFGDKLDCQVYAAESGMAEAVLYDPAGRIIRNMHIDLSQGINHLTIDKLGQLANGIYSLKLNMHGKMLQRTVYHQN